MKTAVFIPARTKSTRLPNKALLEIKGKPVIEHLIDRVKLAKLPDLIVLCTTINPEDVILGRIAERNNISHFQGSEKDILNRYLKAAFKYKVDFIVNADGDDVFCDPEYIDRVIELFIQTGADFIKCEGLPFGVAPSGIKVKALEKICKNKAVTNTETGWSRYFTEPGLFKVQYLEVEDEDLRHPEIRLTLDYPEDYEFFKEVFERLYVPGEVFTLKEIMVLLKNNPSITDLNKDLQKEYWETFQRKAQEIQWKKQGTNEIPNKRP